MRVMFLTPYFRPYLGGIERAIEQLALELQKTSEVESIGVLTTKYAFPRVPQTMWADRETMLGDVRVFRLIGYPKWALPFYSVPLVWFSPFRIRSYMKEFDPDIVHFVGDGWFWGHFWAWFWFRKRARFIFTPSFHKLPLNRCWIRPINMFISYIVDRVISLTHLEARLVRRAYLVKPEKQKVIGWGTKSQVSNETTRDSTFLYSCDHTDTANIVTILCVGRIGVHKGQDWLFDVYKDARVRFKFPARLILIGRDEGEMNHMQSRVARDGLLEEVLLLGEVSDFELGKWYSEADILALFSKYEAFGLVYFEAMAYGVPVLTHDVGSNRELLLRGAVVVPQFDKSDAIEAMVKLVNDNQYRLRLSDEARDYATSEFTWTKTADKYLTEYLCDSS